MNWPRWLDPAPHWLWLLPEGAMVLLAAFAFAIPALRYPDENAAPLTHSERDSLRETVDWVKIRPP